MYGLIAPRYLGMLANFPAMDVTPLGLRGVARADGVDATLLKLRAVETSERGLRSDSSKSIL